MLGHSTGVSGTYVRHVICLEGSVTSSRCQKEIKFAYRDRYHSLLYVVK